MNTFAFILGIIIVLLIYILYKFFTQKATTLVETSNLNENQDPISIKNSPTSTRYAYGVWIYINSWYTNSPKTIFRRNGNLELIFDDNSPVLKCKVTTDSTVSTTGSTEEFIITNDFPLQKWTQVHVSVDNSYFDCYIDGKLVTSVKILKPTTPANEQTMLLGGGSSFDAYVNKFQHWDEPISPQTAYESYKEGNGQTSLFKQLANYGLDLTIVKDNVEFQKFNIF